VTTRLKDWLEISTTGFAQRQADRKPEHLLKEVIQNALDATEEVGSTVKIWIRPAKLQRKNVVELIVEDNGPGIDDPANLRTVFSTGKTDSFLLRGRLGQGFKEILCLCLKADIASRDHRMRFFVEKGERVCDVDSSPKASQGVGYFPGTSVAMWMPWPLDSIPALVQYVGSLIIPEGRQVWLNDQRLGERKAEYTIDVTLKTELFQDGKWVRRERPGKVELVKPLFTEIKEEPMIFEMGIPVQDIEWTQPYHVNVLMRIPMNPRRDAVAAGYLKDVYRQILPTLMPKLEPEQLRDEWVSLAVEEADADLRKEIVTTAFGDDAVRAVPSMGRHDWNSDAREMGLKPIDTALLPKGLRDAAQEILPSSREAELQRRETVNVAFNLGADKQDRQSAKDQPLKAFIAWLAGELVGMPVDVRITPELIIRGQLATAAWAEGGRLTLNGAVRSAWQDPMSEGFLGLLVHEVAHENAGHHGDDFRREVERMAGKLARFCLDRGIEVRSRYDAMKVLIEEIKAGAPAR